MKLIKAHAFIPTQYSRKEGNWPKIKLLSTKWLKHQGSVQKQEGTLKPTIAYYETVSVKASYPRNTLITFEHKQTQYTAHPRGSERQRVNLDFRIHKQLKLNTYVADVEQKREHMD